MVMRRIRGVSMEMVDIIVVVVVVVEMEKRKSPFGRREQFLFNGGG